MTWPDHRISRLPSPQGSPHGRNKALQSPRDGNYDGNAVGSGEDDSKTGAGDDAGFGRHRSIDRFARKEKVQASPAVVCLHVCGAPEPFARRTGIQLSTSKALNMVRRQAYDVQREVIARKRQQKAALEERHFSAGEKRRVRIHNNLSTRWEQQPLEFRRHQQGPAVTDQRARSATLLRIAPHPPNATFRHTDRSPISPRRSATAASTDRPAFLKEPVASQEMAPLAQTARPLLASREASTIESLQQIRNQQLTELNGLARRLARLDAVRVRKRLAKEDTRTVAEEMRQGKAEWKSLDAKVHSTQQKLLKAKRKLHAEQDLAATDYPATAGWMPNAPTVGSYRQLSAWGAAVSSKVGPLRRLAPAYTS